MGGVGECGWVKMETTVLEKQFLKKENLRGKKNGVGIVSKFIK